MVGAVDDAARSGTCSRPMPREPEVEVEERLQDRARQPVDQRVDALGARARVERVVRAGMRFAPHVLGYPPGPARYSPGHGPDGHANPARRPRRRGGRGGVGGPAAARPPRLRRPLRRHRAARALGRVLRRRLAGGRLRPARGQRRAVRRGLRERRALAARPGRAARPARRARRAPRDLAGHRRGRARAPRAVGPAAAVGLGPRVRPGDLAPRALRLRARRARAAAQPARGLLAPVDDAVASTNGHGSVEHLVAPGPAEP